MIKKILKKIKYIYKKQNNKNYFPYSYENLNILELKNIKTFSNIFSKSFVDKPADVPKIKFPLQKVGINQRPHIIKIKDIFDDSKEITPQVDLRLYFNLPSNQRGLHMSRIEKAMQVFQYSGYDLKTYAKNLIKYSAELQNKEEGISEINFLYEKLTNKNSSQRLAHEIIEVGLITKLNKDKITHTLGLKVPFINACPCPQRWGIREYYQFLKNKGFSDKEIYELSSCYLFGTHTNLGEASLFIEDINDTLTYNDIYNVLDQSLVITRELLSGKDEFEFVKEALIREQFCEDVAREIVFNTTRLLSNKIDNNAKVKIEVEVDESIHFHNLRVEIEDRFNNIMRLIKNEN